MVQEFINVSTRKFPKPLSWDSAREYYKLVLEPMAQVFPTSELYVLAMDTAERWSYGFYDSLVIASALSSGCETLYSEDMQHGHKIQGLTIVNPFA